MVYLGTKNKLCLRHLSGHLNGTRIRPTAFFCTMKALETCDQKAVVDIESIESQEPMHSAGIDDLNTYQKYFYEICLAITSCQYDVSLMPIILEI